MHLDADTSIKALNLALVSRGYDVTRTPTDWMPLDASDEAQLLGATFLVLAERYPQHGDIILAAQSSWTLSDLIATLDRLLKETQAADWTGQSAVAP